MDTENKDNNQPEGKNENQSGNSDEIKSKIDYLENEKKALIKQRDELKAKLKSIDDSEALKRGEYEKVLASANAELEKIKSEFETVKTFKDKYESLDKTIRADALSKLSDEHKKIAESLPTELLQEYVKINSKHTNGMDAGTNGRGTIDLTGKKWNDFSSVELEQLKKDNESGYMKLYRERFSR